MKSLAVLVCTGCSAMIGLNGAYRTSDHGPPQCSTSPTPPAVDLILAGISAIVVGAVGVGAATASGEGNEGTGAGILIGGFGVIGLTTLASGIYGLHGVDRCHRAEETYATTARDERTATQHREEAWGLTQQAEAAARAGDCATVINLSQRIGELDKDMHDVVFARDVAVARCLDGGS